MTKEDFLAAYNIGHRDGKEDVYCPNDYDDIFNIEQQSCENCCNGNQEEKAKLCQKSYIAGMEHNIKVSKDGQPSEDWNAVLDELNRIGRNAFKDDTDYDNLFDFISNLPNVKPQSKTDILDKIEAEIGQAFLDDKAMQEHTVKKCLGIIDKYKGERKG